MSKESVVSNPNPCRSAFDLLVDPHRILFALISGSTLKSGSGYRLRKSSSPKNFSDTAYKSIL
jgi:hypothetical protein